MTPLRFVRAKDETTLLAWQHVHNVVIPTHPLTLDDVIRRSKVNILDVALVAEDVVGCSTVRPKTGEEPVTVIVRIHPDHRRQGFGSRFFEHVLAVARGLAAERVQTVVLGSNVDGLTFAVHRGFVETSRYTLEGDTVPFVHLARPVDGDFSSEATDSTFPT